jgi:hypothetical protein
VYAASVVRRERPLLRELTGALRVARGGDPVLDQTTNLPAA